MDSFFIPQSTAPGSNPSFNGVALGSSTVTGATTLTAASPTTIRANAAAGAVTVTLPAAASVAGRIFNVKKLDAVNNVTVAANGAEVIDGTNTKVLSTQYTCLILQSNGTSWDILSTN